MELFISISLSGLWSVNIILISDFIAFSEVSDVNMISSLSLYSYSIYSREKLEKEFLQLVSRRHPATQNPNMMQPQLLTMNDMLKLQEDVVSRYLVGRPRIENISSIHIPFAFRPSKSASEPHPLKYVCCSRVFFVLLIPLCY